MKELDSDIAGRSKDTQRIQPKPKTQLPRMVRPVGGQESTKEIEEGTVFDHEDVKHSTRTGSPYVDQNPQKSCVLMPTKIEEDQTKTVRPINVEEHEIDFRAPGLSHAVVNEAEHFRVEELVKKIENHHHREALQADLQQNNVHNPFSNNSKAMIRELGNVELFELCETIPKVQCSHCLLYWNQGIVYCTCGQFLIDSESRRKFTKLRLDALSIPNFVIKKGRSHCARYGKTEEQIEYHMAWNAWKRCCKKVDSQGGHFTGIHDRFLNKTIRIISLQRNLEDTKDNVISPLGLQPGVLVDHGQRSSKSYQKTAPRHPFDLRKKATAQVLLSANANPEVLPDPHCPKVFRVC